jgi:hypothetical protein
VSGLSGIPGTAAVEVEVAEVVEAPGSSEIRRGCKCTSPGTDWSGRKTRLGRNFEESAKRKRNMKSEFKGKVCLSQQFEIA